MSDPTAEQLAREFGEGMADAVVGGLEKVIMRLVEEIATLKVEQAELRDELHTLTKRHEGMLDAYMRHMQAHHGVVSSNYLP